MSLDITSLLKQHGIKNDFSPKVDFKSYFMVLKFLEVAVWPLAEKM